MEQSEHINELAAALAQAQGMMGKAVKSKVNGGFNSKYANIDEVIEACREALSSNGISVVQAPGEFKDGFLYVTTELLHLSDQWIRSTMTMPVPCKTDKNGNVLFDPQGSGKAITYARRYMLAAMVGVAQEDDDGNSTSYRTERDGYTAIGGFVGDEVPEPTEQSTPQPVKAPAGQPTKYACSNCGASVTDKVYEYSLKRYKQPLCYNCQKQFAKQ